MKLTILAAVSALALSGGAALAQSAPSVDTPQNSSGVPVPGTSAGMDSVIPADQASQVVTGTDAPPASTDAATSSIPVPGNTSGIGSAIPAGAASTVVVPNDATPVPRDTSVPVPGTSAGDDTVAPVQ
ncbi:hypothetical protein D3218_12305 [Aureimonas flava]|uniref:Uncharacterized protein n=1 Tax=Aureimonas flava TaxID=2320271 RepID=A0A3A1WHI9_9HYPH|nr:hypothetical protein [Aureimonas flava]RIY00073.1 hypothetical protein D3218_12305 [Aureimonas flava]